MDILDIYNTVKNFLLNKEGKIEPANYVPGVESIPFKDTTRWRNKTGSIRTDVMRMILNESKRQGLNREQAEGALGRTMTESGMGRADDINPMQVNEVEYGLSPNPRDNIRKGIELMKKAYSKYPKNHYNALQSYHRPNRSKWSAFTDEQALKSDAYRRLLRDNEQVRELVSDYYGD